MTMRNPNVSSLRDGFSLTSPLAANSSGRVMPFQRLISSELSRHDPPQRTLSLLHSAALPARSDRPNWLVRNWEEPTGAVRGKPSAHFTLISNQWGQKEELKTSWQAKLPTNG